MDMIHSRSSHALLLLLRFACCLASCLAPVCRADVLNDSANFNIPAQPVRTALIEFSKQADVQVMGRSAALSGLRSTEVKGRLRARDALM